jgi:hypothetical protein
VNLGRQDHDDDQKPKGVGQLLLKLGLYAKTKEKTGRGSTREINERSNASFLLALSIPYPTGSTQLSSGKEKSRAAAAAAAAVTPADNGKKRNKGRLRCLCCEFLSCCVFTRVLCPCFGYGATCGQEQ